MGLNLPCLEPVYVPLKKMGMEGISHPLPFTLEMCKWPQKTQVVLSPILFAWLGNLKFLLKTERCGSKMLFADCSWSPHSPIWAGIPSWTPSPIMHHNPPFMGGEAECDGGLGPLRMIEVWGAKYSFHFLARIFCLWLDYFDKNKKNFQTVFAKSNYIPAKIQFFPENQFWW